MPQNKTNKKYMTEVIEVNTKMYFFKKEKVLCLIISIITRIVNTNRLNIITKIIISDIELRNLDVNPPKLFTKKG